MIHIRWKALLPIGGVIAGFVLSPDFLALVPSTVSHVIVTAGVLIQVLVPGFVTKKPSC
jgi:hypothetical protein